MDVDIHLNSFRSTLECSSGMVHIYSLPEVKSSNVYSWSLTAWIPTVYI